jgi:hypothetical protein
MLKLITYYRSNPSHEFRFYGRGHKENSSKLSKEELNAIINEAIAESPEPDDDDDDNDNEIINEVRRTTDGHIISNHEIIIWIEKTLDLNSQEIIKELGELPISDDDDDDNSLNKTGNEIEEEEEEGRGVMDYDIKELAKRYMNE